MTYTIEWTPEFGDLCERVSEELGFEGENDEEEDREVRRIVDLLQKDYTIEVDDNGDIVSINGLLVEQ